MFLPNKLVRIALLLSSGVVAVQAQAPTGATPVPARNPAVVGSPAADSANPIGIPIDDQITIRKCGGCHQPDAATGMMRRLSYIRTTPEVWQQAIKRMIRLNGLTATPEEVRHIVRYLSNNNGLAPEEMKASFWEVEHRTNGYQDDYVPNVAIQKTCNYCHNIGRVLAQRRTREDYEKLVAMHIGLFPGVENGVFRPSRPTPVAVTEAAVRVTTTANGGIALEPPRAVTPPANAKFPFEIALDYLATAQPLITPEWTAWRAAMRPPKIAGSWLLSGYQPGRGKVFGQVTIAPGAADDQFATTAQIFYASSGTATKFTGKSIVYTGYSWRGRSTSGASTSGSAAASRPATSTPVEYREAMMLSRDGNSLEGRWFWGAFGELGMDVHLTRLGSEPTVVGTDLSALQTASKAEVKIYGGNLTSLKPADVDLGPGMNVLRVVKADSTSATVEVEAAKGLRVGMRDLSVGRSTVIKALAVYDKVNYIRVTPDARMSRLGGVKYPKEFAQYDAIAFASGPDGKAHTADDVPLGPVSAKWAIEEFYSTPDDDDIKFVGSIDDSGLFTPSVEGPNPNRKKQSNNTGTNNFGDVWVVASYQPPGGEPVKAQSYLVVTVPKYTIYDQPEVAQ